MANSFARLGLVGLLLACGTETLPPPSGGAGSNGSTAGNAGAAPAAGASGSSSAGTSAGGVAGSMLGNAGVAGSAGNAGSAAGGVSGGAGAGGAAAGSGPVLPEGNAGAPPEQWTEHWFEHVQVLDLVEYNEWVVLYFDTDVNRDQTAWLLPFLTQVWQYTLQHY